MEVLFKLESVMKKFTLAIIELFLMFSCQSLEPVNEFIAEDEELFASMEMVSDTKTVMDEYNNVLWSEDDQIVAFMRSTLGLRYMIKEQYVGTTTGGFSRIHDPETGTDLVSGQELDHNVVLYPYASSTMCMKNDAQSPAMSYNVNVVLPQVQYYAENSFGNGAFPMIAVSQNNELTFRNICGGLKLQFKGTGKIKSIVLEGLGEEPVSGNAAVVGYVDGSAPTVAMTSTASKSVTLDCGDGVQLNEDTATTFIIAVPPTEFQSGMKITVTDAEGSSKIFTNSSPNTIKRSSLLTFPVITYNQEAVPSKKSLNILFVGNSLTQDGIAYLPYMLKNYYPEVDFKIYMWYIGGYTLGQQYATFSSDGKANIFSVAENSQSWTNYSKNTTMKSVLSTYSFDIVCMQEFFNYKSEYKDAADWNNCREYILSNYKGGNELEFISLFHAPLRKEGYDVHDVYKRTEAGNALILQTTDTQDMIPNGIAVYRALQTELDALGDQQHLSPDGTHTQEGLPCLLQTYVTLCWVFDRLGIEESIYGHPMRMTTAVYNKMAVPGANLGKGVVTGTDAQYILAQQIAINAYNEGKDFVRRCISSRDDGAYYYSSLNEAMADMNDASLGRNSITDLMSAEVVLKEEGDRYTCSLLKDADNVSVEVKRPCLIDLMGHSLMSGSDKPLFDIYDSCEISNGTIAGKADGSGTRNAPWTFVRVNSQAKLTCRDISASFVDVLGGTIAAITVMEDASAEMYDSEIVVDSPIGLMSTCITNYGSCLLENTNMRALSNHCANAAGNDYGQTARALYSESGSVTTFKNSCIYGAHSGATVKGRLYVDGGTYEGYSHGGLYISNAGEDTLLKNATITECPLPDGYIDDGVAGTNHAGIYIGGSSNMRIYVDNCDFYGLQQPIVLRGSSGESNNILYISNSRINLDYTHYGVRNDGSNQIKFGINNNFCVEDLKYERNYEVTSECYGTL